MSGPEIDEREVMSFGGLVRYLVRIGEEQWSEVNADPLPEDRLATVMMNTLKAAYGKDR